MTTTINSMETIECDQPLVGAATEQLLSKCHLRAKTASTNHPTLILGIPHWPFGLTLKLNYSLLAACFNIPSRTLLQRRQTQSILTPLSCLDHSCVQVVATFTLGFFNPSAPPDHFALSPSTLGVCSLFTLPLSQSPSPLAPARDPDGPSHSPGTQLPAFLPPA